MNASLYPLSPDADLFGGPPPVLIAATSPAAGARAAATIETAGYRTATVMLEDAAHRLDIQAAATAFWLELDEDAGTLLDGLLDRVEAEVSSGRFPAIIAAPASMIDPIATRIRHASIELLIDGSAPDRVEALAVAVARSRQNYEGVAEDVNAEPSAARLRQLSDEVSRIAATLARLSVGPAAVPEKPEAPTGDAPSVSIEAVQQVIRARRLRARFFDEELFADPAWDMLLDLLQAEIAQHRVPVSSLCIAAAVPATTALRWF